MKNTLYLGLDVHKDSIVIAIALSGRNGEVRLYGTITNDLQALEKALRKIRQRERTERPLARASMANIENLLIKLSDAKERPAVRSSDGLGLGQRSMIIVALPI
jgi:hypothetical protein